MWTRPDFSPMPRNWLIFQRKMRSIHKTGQQNLWRSNSNHPKANQSQNTSHSIVAGAHRKQWGHILEDQQRRNVGKLHGSVRKGPPPHLATWKPEPRGYTSFDHHIKMRRWCVVSYVDLSKNRLPLEIRKSTMDISTTRWSFFSMKHREPPPRAMVDPAWKIFQASATASSSSSSDSSKETPQGRPKLMCFIRFLREHPEYSNTWYWNGASMCFLHFLRKLLSLSLRRSTYPFHCFYLLLHLLGSDWDPLLHWNLFFWEFHRLQFISIYQMKLLCWLNLTNVNPLRTSRISSIGEFSSQIESCSASFACSASASFICSCATDLPSTPTGTPSHWQSFSMMFLGRKERSLEYSPIRTLEYSPIRTAGVHIFEWCCLDVSHGARLSCEGVRKKQGFTFRHISI